MSYRENPHFSMAKRTLPAVICDKNEITFVCDKQITISFQTLISEEDLVNSFKL